MRGERRERVGGEHGWLAARGREHPQEVAGQRDGVLRTVAQRRHAQGHDLQAAEEIRAELPLADPPVSRPPAPTSVATPPVPGTPPVPVARVGPVDAPPLPPVPPVPATPPVAVPPDPDPPSGTAPPSARDAFFAPPQPVPPNAQTQTQVNAANGPIGKFMRQVSSK
jgi:hypothetical protein